ncbi:TIGR04086 family membrane protein [Ruminococcus albus]|uniref:Putative membrane protein, TIGR04086 family n=1 Tax=Ruminococcus albus TaxID=1264 RepID=A0A1I1DXL8_RUMAL|nr:TIGR04086 family membrane protein [Ruminococcus albus]SFB77748.1 putative membrane protein, TIGR04086 family [Ruminococcus albus]
MRKHRSNARGLGIVAEQIVALTVAAGVILLLVCAMAFLLTKIDAGKSVLSAMSTGALVIGAYFGGYTGGKRRKRNGLAAGALTGLLMFVFILITGSIFAGYSARITSFGKLLLTVAAASIGGAIGVNVKRVP